MEQDKVERWIEGQLPNIIKDLTRICRIRSVANPEEKEELPYGAGCKEALKEMLLMGEENGFTVRNYEDYVGCISYGDTSEEYQAKAIGIWSHLDVVDEGSLDRWQYSPYNPVVKEGYFIARGCQDNKSSAIMGLYVMKYFKEHQIELKHGLQLYLGTCEEQGMYDLDYYTKHYLSPALSLVPDSGFPVCFGERGIFNGELRSNHTLSESILEFNCNGSRAQIPDMAFIQLKGTKEELGLQEGLTNGCTIETEAEETKIIAHGVPSHTATPKSGENALLLLTNFLCDKNKPILTGKDLELFQFLHRINSDYSGAALQVACEDNVSGPVTLTASYACIQDRHLTIQFYARLPISKNDYPFQEKAKEAAEKNGFSLKVLKHAKSNYFPPDHPAVSVLTDTYNRIMGLEAKPFVMSGGTYASKLPRAFAFGTGGLPIPKPPKGLFLPGHGDYHQPDEAISLERVKKAILVYIYGILELNNLGQL